MTTGSNERADEFWRLLFFDSGFAEPAERCAACGRSIECSPHISFRADIDVYRCPRCRVYLRHNRQHGTFVEAAPSAFETANHTYHTDTIRAGQSLLA